MSSLVTICVFISNTDHEDPALKLVRDKILYQRRKKQILDLFHRKYKEGKSNL